MKGLKLILSILIGIGFVYALNTKLGQLPPIGKFLNPFSGFWQNAENVNAHPVLNCHGTKQEVNVLYDEQDIPHIFAANEEDLYYAQGYVVAKDRLWQMDIQTRMAEGRLSEFLGDKTLKLDREKRRIGLKYASEKAAEKFLNEETKMVMNQFTKGVNDYIHSLDYKDLPLEYKLLDYEPLDWTSERSALLLKAMAERLTGNELDVENSNFVKIFGQEMFDVLFPNYVADQSPIIPKGTVFKSPNAARDSLSTFQSKLISQHPIEKSQKYLGSNNWAISASRSQSGNPILCNDPHLVLNLPSVWYEMHLVCPTMNVYGVTLPGAPGIIIGFNKDIAWGLTNAGRDVRNWYAIKYRDSNRNEYWYDSAWHPITKRIEHIKVRNGEDVYDTVLYTHHGPIVYDQSFNAVEDQLDMALSWTAYIPSNELLTFYKLNKAVNYEEYIAAINHFVCPAQNFVFASTTGDIAIKQQGLFPLVEPNRDKFILDGSRSENDMNRFVPIEENPSVLNPERGFVSSANQHPTDESYPYYYSSGEFEYNRNRRINDILQSKEKHSMADLMRLQGDNYNYTAAMVLPKLLEIAAASGKENAWVNKLKHWNYMYEANSKEAVIYEAWWTKIQALIWDELSEKKAILSMPDQYITATLVRDNGVNPFVDFVQTKDKVEGMEDIIAMSMDSLNSALNAFEKNYGNNAFTWANYKGTEIMHMAKIEAFSHKNIQIGGSKNIVNAVGKIWGPSWRMVVELTPNGPVGFGVYPGGQSGNPGSKFFDDNLERWRTIQYRKLNYCAKMEEVNKPIAKIIFNQD